MKKFNIPIFLCLLIILQNCKDVNKHKEYLASTDTVRLQIPTEALDLYNTIDYNIKNDLLIGYNHFEHSIQFFKVDTPGFYKSIELSSDGPDAIPTVSDVLLTNEHIILIAFPEIVRLDINGNLLDKWKVNELEGLLNYEYSINGGFNINHLQQNEIGGNGDYMYLYLYPAKLKTTDFRPFNNPLFCRFYFDQKKIDIIDITYPDIFRKDYNYGVLTNPTAIEVNNDIVFSFPNHSTIYKYSRINDQHKIISNKPETDVISSEIKIEQSNNIRDIIAKSITGDQYLPIKYDQKNRQYYRVVRVKNNVTDLSKQYLLIFNEQFDLVKELELDSDIIFGQDFAITKKGILFQLKDSKSEDLDFSYILININ